MASVTAPSVSLYPDITASIVSDGATGLPTAIQIQPGANVGVAWEILFQGSTITGAAAAGAPLQTVPLNGAVAATDLQTITLGQHLTASGVPLGAKAGA